MTSKTGAPEGVNTKQAAFRIADQMMTCVAAFGCDHPEIIRLELFGSFARGEATASSDVDLVVTFAPSLKDEVRGFAFFGYLDDLERDLTIALGRSVHLTDRAGVDSSVRIGNTAFAKAIARDGQLVYEADHSTEGRARPHRGELPQSSGTRR